MEISLREAADILGLDDYALKICLENASINLGVDALAHRTHILTCEQFFRLAKVASVEDAILVAIARACGFSKQTKSEQPAIDAKQNPRVIHSPTLASLETYAAELEARVNNTKQAVKLVQLLIDLTRAESA